MGNHIVFLEEGILWSMELHSVLYQHSALNWKRGRDLSWSPIRKSDGNFFNWKSLTVGLGVITYRVPSKAVVAGEKKHSRGGRPVACNLVLVDRCVLFGPEMLLKIGRSHIKLWISGLKKSKALTKRTGPNVHTAMMYYCWVAAAPFRLHVCFHFISPRERAVVVRELGEGVLRSPWSDYLPVWKHFNVSTTDMATSVHTSWMWWWGMEAREDGNVALLKDVCEQENEEQIMSSLQCQAKEVPPTGFHKRRREWMRVANGHTAFQVPILSKPLYDTDEETEVQSS